MTLALAALILLSISLAACQYAGKSANPMARNFTWFDYLGAENLKAACGQGASDRLRFIDKPIFDTQIRLTTCRSFPAAGARRCSLGSGA